MKLFTGWVLAAGLAMAGTTAQAQGPSPYSRVSDFNGPYSEAPYYREEGYREEGYRGGPYYAPPPPEAPSPPRYGYGYGPAAPALLPVHEVYNIIREAGFSPLGIPHQRGNVYTIAVIDRGGEDGRLVIDGRSGQIIRFTPAWRTSGILGGAFNSVDGRPGPLPPPAIHVAGAPRPPASVPRVASRTVPVPKPSPLAANAATAPAKPAARVAAKPAAEPSPQQAAIAQAKPADTAPPAQVEAKPAAPAILPTQEMPKAQGLE